MRIIATVFAGLLTLATLPGMTSSAMAGGTGDRNAGQVRYSLVGDRGDHHRGYRGYYGHGYGRGNWGYHQRHYYPRYYSYPRYYNYRYRPYNYYYRAVPPRAYYVPPPAYYAWPPAYGYGYNDGGFNLGFNFNFD